MSESVLNTTSRFHKLRRDGSGMMKVLAPFFAIIMVVIYYHEFVVNAILINKAINGLIIAASTYGVILIIMRQVSAQRDFYVIDRFGRESKQGAHMPQLLEQSWLKKCYVRHYLSHIAHTGGTLSSEMQQSAIENELHALAAEYEHKLEMPQFIVGFMVAMGLLGTFVGLLETLTGISGMLEGFGGGGGGNMDEQFMHLVGELKKPLAGMGIAFSASMFGLVTSLMLAMMMINLRRYIARVVSCARNVMHDLTEMARQGGGSGVDVSEMSIEDFAALAAAGDPRKAAVANIDGDGSLQDIVYRAHDTSLLVANRIDGLAKKIEALLQAFDTSIKSTQKMNDLMGFGPRMKETSEAMLGELKVITNGQIEQQKLAQILIESNNSVAHLVSGAVLGELKTLNNSQIEQQKLAQILIESNSEVAHLVSGVVLGELKTLNNSQIEQQKLSQTLIESSNDVTRTIGGVVLGELKNLTAGQIEQQKLAQGMIDAEAGLSRVVGSIVEFQIKGQAEEVLALKDVSSKLVKIEESSNSVGRHLWGIKEDLTKLGAYSGIAESISEGIGHQKLLLETLVAEDRNLQKRLVSIQQDIREHLQSQPVDGGAVTPPV